jgi:hypothetical protein
MIMVSGNVATLCQDSSLHCRTPFSQQKKPQTPDLRLEPGGVLVQHTTKEPQTFGGRVCGSVTYLRLC